MLRSLVLSAACRHRFSGNRSRKLLNRAKPPKLCSMNQQGSDKVELTPSNRNDPLKWDTDGLLRWAKQLRNAKGLSLLSEAHLDILKANLIEGTHLPTLTVEELERWGFPGGPAKSFVAAVEKTLGVPNVQPQSGLLFLPESHNVSRLWQALLKGEAKHMRRNNTAEDPMATEETNSTEHVGAFVLPEGIDWLHQIASDGEKRGHALFVRKCSFEICDLIDQYRRNRRRGVVVIGTPGIGKSWLSNLLLLRAAQEKRNVIFESVREDVVYVFNGTTGIVNRVKSPRNFDWPFADDYNTLYIMDAGGRGVHREPIAIDAFTVVLASPNEKHYGQFAKEIGLGSRLFLPDWSLEDLKAVLPFVEDREAKRVTTDAIVEERFRHFGGIPRLIFGSQDDCESAMSSLNQSLRSLSKFDLSILDSKDTQWHLVPNYVFTLRSVHPFGTNNTFVARASKYVEEQAKKILDSKKMRFLEEFTFSWDGLTKQVFGSSQGRGFEKVSQGYFSRGAPIRIRSLSSQSTQEEQATQEEQVVHFKPTDLHDFVGTIEADTIYWPQNPNFKAVDCFFLRKDTLLLVQATMCANRPMASITDFLAQPLPTNIDSVQLWYLVPQEKNAAFYVSTSKKQPRKRYPGRVTIGKPERSVPLEIFVASWVTQETPQ